MIDRRKPNFSVAQFHSQSHETWTQMTGQFQSGQRYLSADMGFKYGQLMFDMGVNNKYEFTLSFTQPISLRFGFGMSAKLAPFANPQPKANTKFHFAFRNNPFDTHENEDDLSVQVSTGIGPDSLQLTYSREVFNGVNVVVGSDFTFQKKSPLGGEKDWNSSFKIGYICRSEHMPPTRGMIDSDGTIMSLLKIPMESTNFELSLSANFLTNQYEAGFGVELTHQNC